MNCDFEGKGHESIVEYFNVYSDIRLKGLRKTLRNLSITSCVSQNLAFDPCEWTRNSPGGDSLPSHFRAQKCTQFFVNDAHRLHPDVTKIEICRQILVNVNNTKFRENPSSCSPVARRTDKYAYRAMLINEFLHHLVAQKKISVGNATEAFRV